ncbi:hypothetical protein DPMN_191655 [Dreissena polymorpha]|uniref:Uncharacterized protein n=1 Tax=Dreissena polymorpha TaxID=45954 RepID=A0A9D3XYP4_DREPO|nr:hypothetical protein DPMN_191655 [Dreissena polymorpha]
MSTITENAGCYDISGGGGNMSRNQPPRVKPQQDTTDVKTGRFYMSFSPSNWKIILLLITFSACRTSTGFKTDS